MTRLLIEVDCDNTRCLKCHFGSDTLCFLCGAESGGSAKFLKKDGWNYPLRSSVCLAAQNKAEAREELIELIGTNLKLWEAYQLYLPGADGLHAALLDVRNTGKNK